jgi:molybdenum cofactor synthesis domain-containing protein
MRIAVLTVSDGVSSGEREDLSGALLEQKLAPLGEVVCREVAADERAEIADVLRLLCDHGVDDQRIDLIVTTGGTGLGPRDVTPEATRDVIKREAPGVAEAMRAATLAKTPMAMLSRATAGIRGRTLIVNLPGSPKGVEECLEVVLPVLPHAVDILGGGGHGA